MSGITTFPAVVERDNTHLMDGTLLISNDDTLPARDLKFMVNIAVNRHVGNRNEELHSISATSWKFTATEKGRKMMNFQYHLKKGLDVRYFTISLMQVKKGFDVASNAILLTLLFMQCNYMVIKPAIDFSRIRRSGNISTKISRSSRRIVPTIQDTIRDCG
jgi:adenosine deaminase